MQNTALFRIYDASAGSGKTFTLVRNYISRLVLAHEISAYQNMLAITFTNKAVAEMKSRIVESLRAFSQKNIPQSSSALFREVQGLTGLSEGQIQVKSKAILKSILHNYAGFEVSTIDGFNHRILRTFAKDLNIPVNFEVELDIDEILQEAVDRVISKAGKDKILTKTLIDFAFAKADDDRSWDITNDLNDIAKLLVNENNYEYLAALRGRKVKDFSDFEKKMHQKIKALKMLLLKKADEFFELIQKNDLDFKDFTRSSLPNFFQKIKAKTFPYPSGAQWQKDVKEGNTLYPKRAKFKSSIIESIQPQITEIYSTVEKTLFTIELLKRLCKRNPALSLLTAIEKEMGEIKEERGLLLISEFNKKISDSIKDQPAPFIYERLGERYHTYYIDEFQDTSELQWTNIQPLIGDSLASGEGELTLVGDAKQSIYRWRGGRAEQFMALCGEYSPFPEIGKVEKLPNNFRSLPKIVDFNNTFFKHAASFLNYAPYRKLYEQVAQKPQKSKVGIGGYVNIRFVEAENAAEEEKIYPQEVFKILENLKQQTVFDTDEEKNRHLNGVCVLVRKKKQGVVIADYLSEKGIPIISSETLLLRKSPKVNFLISLLQFSLNPTDDNQKFAILNDLYQQIGSCEPYYSFIHSRLDFGELDFFKSIQKYGFVFDLHKFKNLPIYDAIEYSLRAFKLHNPPDGYIQFFLDFVYEYAQNHSGGISGFLDLWELKKDKLSITAPEGKNAVQIMTIHTAKGLEFPVVIYPFANEQIDDTRKDDIWVELEEEPRDIPVAYLSANKKLADFGEGISEAYNSLRNQTELDNMNVAYVALTRAEEQLYILSKYDVTKKGEEKTNLFSGLLINYLKSKQLWKEEQFVYEFGELTEAFITESTTQQEDHLKTEIEDFISSAPEDHSIDMMTKSVTMWGSVQAEAIEVGNIIHELLKEVYLKTDVDKVVETALSKGILLKEERKKYTEILENLVNHPDLAPYFSQDYTIYTEKEIISDHEFKRLDRLCVKGEEAVIIDYKTGIPQPSHQTQVNTYAVAIEEMGFQVCDKILIYLSEEDMRIERIA